MPASPARFMELTTGLLTLGSCVFGGGGSIRRCTESVCGAPRATVAESARSATDLAATRMLIELDLRLSCEPVIANSSLARCCSSRCCSSS